MSNTPLDLTTLGSSGVINGAIYRQGETQPAGSGELDSFVRVQNSPQEQGFNTDGTPQFDTKSGAFTHSLTLSAVPLVSIDGKVYREFVLDINQEKNEPLLSLDQVQIFLGAAGNLTSYPNLGTLIYDSGEENWVKLNYSLAPGSGGADMYLDVPNELFTGANQYVYLYSHFGAQNLNDGDTVGSSNDGYEEWATPTLGGTTSTITTTIHNDATDTVIPVNSVVPAGTSTHDSATVTGNGSKVPTGSVTFTFYSTIDGTGPSVGAGTVMLDPSGVAHPSDASGALTPGSYSYRAHYNGDSTYLPSDSAVEPFTVTTIQTSLATTLHNASNDAVVPINSHVSLGTSIYDTSVLSGQLAGLPATGTLTYQYYTTIDGTGPHTDQVVNLNPDGTIPKSAIQGPLAAGSYSFITVYSGDVNYQSTTSDVEPFIVDKARLSISTTLHDAAHNVIAENGHVSLGTSTHDNATVTGAVAGFAIPTISFTLQGNSIGSGPTDDGFDATSVGSSPLGAGSYTYNASIAGDDNYIGATSVDEHFFVDKARLSISTTVHDAAHNVIAEGAHVAVGTNTHDNATVTGAVAGFAIPTISFTLQGNSIGSGSTEGGFNATSTASGALGAGNYTYNASVAGDDNYFGAVSVDEHFTVDKADPTITTQAYPVSGVVGIVVLNDKATLSGGYIPTGTIVFTLKAPDSSIVYTNTITVNGNGVYDTKTMGNNPSGKLALQTGNYTWVAVYSGDVNNNGAQDDGVNETATVLGAQDGKTIGFWGNKNGQKVLTGKTGGTTLLASFYDPLFGAKGALVNPCDMTKSVLVDANGNYVKLSDLNSYSFINNYLQNATATNMAYMLSAQMLATEFNVLAGYVAAGSLIYLPAVSTLTASHLTQLAGHGFTGTSYTVQQFLNAAILELIAHPKTIASGPDRIYQEALKNIFDAVNNNQPIFL
ncbi:Ig-like domain-containing protein [Paludisphaera rhizosphaerae]|uniref:Ig-like domain-containing protein n=1 Tax=Paludisphaera rhizosphaerae TaxID=2711216 RepID=UPI0013EAB58B|nr:Ig-like domain-containing protein [Paludisphaera rhizosphaerae]